MKIIHRFKVAKAVAAVTYKEWSAYRTHSMVSIFVGPVYFMVQFMIWNAVYGHGTSTIHNMGLNEIITYFGAVTLIGYLTMDFADWNLQMLIRTGKFLTFSLRPIHHRFFALSQKIGHRFLGFMVEFVPCFLIFQFIFKVNMIPKYPGWTILSIVLAYLMNFYVNYCIGMTAFWLTSASGIKEVYTMLSSLLSGAVIPLVFFPKILQKALFFLPFQYVSYVPARVFSGAYSLGGVEMSLPVIVGCQAIAVAIVMILSEIIYRRAIKRYIAVGG
ncbi:MAG: ABC-2 family transporter protein [Lachnospiraceae bacterium]|nr:ABC-2 family transporter protein [Lachnospiraceae bacterium]